MKRPILSLLAGPVLAVACLAQVSHSTASHESTPPVIDGAKTPSLIPDLTAWRLWLLAASAADQAHPDKATGRRHAFLKIAGILPDDLNVADSVLVQFRSDYEALVSRFNGQLDAHQNPSFAEFKAERDSLVEASRTSLLGSLAPASARQCINFVREEKARMKVAREEVQ